MKHCSIIASDKQLLSLAGRADTKCTFCKIRKKSPLGEWEVGHNSPAPRLHKEVRMVLIFGVQMLQCKSESLSHQNPKRPAAGTVPFHYSWSIYHTGFPKYTTNPMDCRRAKGIFLLKCSALWVLKHSSLWVWKELGVNTNCAEKQGENPLQRFSHHLHASSKNCRATWAFHRATRMRLPFVPLPHPISTSRHPDTLSPRLLLASRALHWVTVTRSHWWG